MQYQLPKAALLIGLLCPIATLADDVYLENGKVFEDVIATVSGDSVNVRFAYGQMTLSLASVREIRKAESETDEYLSRRAELRAAGGAQDWLDLARWARSREIEHATREAALEAARHDPHLDGLAPLLRELDYVFSEELSAWISRDEYLRSQGYVRSFGEWISPEEVAERRRREESERAALREARAAARDDRIADAVELLTLKTLAEQAQPQPVAPQVAGLPVGVIGAYYVPRRRHRVISAPYVPYLDDREDPPGALDILVRQPGSLFPIRSHRGALRSTRHKR